MNQTTAMGDVFAPWIRHATGITRITGSGWGGDDMCELDDRFAQDLEQRPGVYLALRSFALDAARSTYGRIGMKAVAERARWEAHIEQGNPDFKINNSLVSRYARLLHEREPELRGRFEFRALKGDRNRFDHLVVPGQGVLFKHEVECPSCSGTGEFPHDPGYKPVYDELLCTRCDGSGFVEENYLSLIHI